MKNNCLLELDLDYGFTEEELYSSRKMHIFLDEDDIINKAKAKSIRWMTGAIGYLSNGEDNYTKVCFLFAHGCKEKGGFQFSPKKIYAFSDIYKVLKGYYPTYLEYDNQYLNKLYKSLLIAENEKLPIFIHGCYDHCKKGFDDIVIKPLTNFDATYSYSEDEYVIIDSKKFVKFTIEEA